MLLKLTNKFTTNPSAQVMVEKQRLAEGSQTIVIGSIPQYEISHH